MTITRNMVAGELAKLPRDRKNISLPMGCAYTAPTGEHCIGGEVLKNLGVNLPKWGDALNQGAGIEMLARQTHLGIMPEAIALLASAQSKADINHGKPDQATWGEVVDKVLERPAAFEASKRRHPSAGGAIPGLIIWDDPPAANKAAAQTNWLQPYPAAPKKDTLADFLQANPVGFDQVYTPKAPAPDWMKPGTGHLGIFEPKPAWIDTTTHSKTKTALLEPLEPKTFSTKELEQYAGVPEPTLRRWRDQGIIDNIHYPPTVQWSEGEARIARVLSRLPALSPALYLKVAHWLRVGTKNRFDMFLTIIGEDVRLVSGVALASYCRATAGRAVTVLPLEQL